MNKTAQNTDQRADLNAAITANIPDDELAIIASQATDDAKFYRNLADFYNGEVIRRMNIRGTSMLISPDFLGEKKSSKSYVWDTELAEDTLKPNVPPEMWDAVFTITPPPPPPPPVKKVETVKMLALGEKLGLDLTPFYRIDEKNPRIEWTPRGKQP